MPSTGGGGHLAKKGKCNPRKGGWKQNLQVRWEEAQQSWDEEGGEGKCEIRA